MAIDWVTIAAQAFNFLLLVWLMKRFLYKPILNAIDAREKKIAETIADAEQKEAAAQAEHQLYLQKNEELQRHRTEQMSQAAREADAHRLQLLEEAENEASHLRARRKEMLAQDAQRTYKEIGVRIREEVFAVARKALADLSSTTLEERVNEEFIRRIRDLDGDSKRHMAKTLSASGEPALVNSAFGLSGEQREHLRNAVSEALSMDVVLEFKTVPDLIGGIELVLGGYKVAWNVADYITSLEDSVNRLADEGSPRGQ